MADLSQSYDDGTFLEVITLARSNFYGEHPQNRLNVRGVNGYLDQGLPCASLWTRRSTVPWLSS